MDVIVPLPPDLVTSYAQFWHSDRADFVLIEEVVEWLAESGITYRLLGPDLTPHTDPHYETLWVYGLMFLDERDALLFKLTWC